MTYRQKQKGFHMHGRYVPPNCWCGRPGKMQEFILGNFSGNLCVQHAKEAKLIWAQHSGSTPLEKAA